MPAAKRRKGSPTRALARRAAYPSRAQGDGYRLGLAVAVELHLDLVARRVGLDDARQAGGAADLATVDLEDDVTGLDAGRVGGAARQHLRDEGAAVALDVEPILHLRHDVGHVAAAHAEERAALH